MALECPQKLFYSSNPDYFNKNEDNDFLQSLAEGGYQVGELAKVMYPKGIEVTADSTEEQIEETRQLLQQQKNIILFEGSIQHENFLVRVDIIDKKGDTMRLIEVKSKSYNALDENYFLNTKGGFNTEILPYLRDIAYQTFVARLAYPDVRITPFLMLPDKAKTATVDGLNQMFPIKRISNGEKRIVVERRAGLKLEDIGEPILTEVNVSEFVDQIIEGILEAPGTVASFSDAVHAWAKSYASAQPIHTPLHSKCKKCEFRGTPGTQLKSGLHECWERETHLSQQELNQPLILDVWDGRKTKNWLAGRKYLMSQLTQEDIDLKPGKDIMSRTDRQWMQISGEGLASNGLYFNRDYVANEMAQWKFPLNLIDFETSRTVLPFHKHRNPLELVAFQFSHHILHEDGSLEHAGEFLATEPGYHPNIDFLRALRDSVESNDGTVLTWSPYENSVLNELARQLTNRGDAPDDAADLIRFAHSLTYIKEGNKVVQAGGRLMYDLCKLSAKVFFHKYAKGSNSIKKVLPAMLRSSKFLKDKYSQPIYGGGRANSKNYKDPIAWWHAGPDGNPIDPYYLLPPVFNDMDIPDDEDEDAKVAQGGAAIMAYARLQFEHISDQTRNAWRTALLKYCELDTVAMAMVVEGWQDWVKNGTDQ